MKIQPFELERYFARYEFSAPYQLSPSDCEPFSLSELLEIADADSLRLWEQLWLGYTESRGLPALRAEIAAQYRGLNAEDLIILTPEEGIFIAMNVLLKAGDHVVVTAPGYQSLYQIAESIGCRVSRWMPRTENGNFVFDPADLERLLEEHTRLIVVNFPHNPTGALPDAAAWKRIFTLAEARGSFIFSDEMYRFLEYDPADRLAAACEMYENAVSLSGVSKAYALPGLRIGWLATRSRPLLEQIACFKDYTTICSSAPSEVLALAALRRREQVLARSLAILHTNRQLLGSFFARRSHLFSPVTPRAGTICFPEWRGAGSVEEFSSNLVEQKGVMLLPSSVYDDPGKHFRLGFGRRNFPDALALLEEYLDQND